MGAYKLLEIFEAHFNVILKIWKMWKNFTTLFLGIFHPQIKFEKNRPKIREEKKKSETQGQVVLLNLL